MGFTVETSALYSGADALGTMGEDVKVATNYLDQHIDRAQGWVQGLAMQHILSQHSEYVASIDSGLGATKRCFHSVSSALTDVGGRYDATEDDALVAVGDLFRDLDDSVVSTPITASTPRKGVNVSDPSKCLVVPTSVMSEPPFSIVWNILSWPDYLSMSYWLRQTIKVVGNLLAPHFFQGRGIFELIAVELGGDWDQLAKAGGAFGYLGDYFQGSSDALHDVGVDIFSSWSEGDGADAAGEFFAELVAALAAQTQVYADLEQKYTNAAWAAFAACQTLLSAVDALGDAIIAATMTGKSLVEGLAALVTAGTTIPAAVVSATVAVIEAFSAAWNIMMTAASGTIALGAGLGAATQEIEFVRLPEV